MNFSYSINHNWLRPILRIHNCFMEDIQKQLTDKLLSSDLDSYPVSLLHGKMGLSIFFYPLSKIESNAIISMTFIRGF